VHATFIESFKAEVTNHQETIEAVGTEEVPEEEIDDAPIEAEQAPVAIDAAIPVPEEIDNAAEFVKSLLYAMGSERNKIPLSGDGFVYAHKNSSIFNKYVYSIAEKTKKHVVVVDKNIITARTREMIRSMEDELRKKIIFIHPNPDHPKLYPAMKMAHSLFGRDIAGLHQLHGGATLNNNHDPEKPHPLGPVFSEFDYAYRDYKTGVIWALQRKNEVFFTFSITNCEGSITEAVMSELCDRYCGSLPYEEMLKRDIAYFEKSSQNDKQQFVKLAITNSKSLIDELRQKYLQAKEEYIEHMGKAMEFAKIAQRLEDNLVTMDEEKLASKEEERCTKMYEDVMTIPKVSAVKVIGDIVNVYTKNIYVLHETTKKFHDIGTFHIAIGMYGSSYNTSETVKIFNTKHQVHAFHEAMQAPHVFEDGHLCHGNAVGPMIDAYKRRDLYQMVLMLIMFLENANLDDPAGVYIGNWPVVTDEAAKSCEMKDEFAKIFEEKTEEESKFDDILDIPIHI
jgi:hypothetical protein